MKRFLSIPIFVTAVLCLTAAASAQSVKVSNVLGKHFLASNRAIELELPDEMDGVWFIVGWIKADGQQIGMRRVGRAGRHCYDMRQHPDWKGQIQAVAVNVTGVRGRVKEPTFLDELDMFWEPEWITPSTVNVLTGRLLFSRSWNVILLLILGVSTLFFAGFRKKPIVLSLILGFLFSWGVMDLRAVYDRAVAVYEVESHHLEMPPLMNVKKFSDRASEIIGRATWRHEPFQGVYGSFIKYRLAEHPYAPPGSDLPAPYLLTQTPKDRQVLWQYADYCLIQKDPP
ncbi:MAG: hypothetical protein EXS64_18370 [Candidatus Latescibacteria bacterium]|nr:hypothetical protein [Candidatus Latescibacterota bacterium]